MKSKPLKILLFDGTFRTTVFINRLAAGLAQNHHVIIAGFNETLTQKVPGVTYIGLGDNNNIFKFIRAGSILTLKTLVKFGDIAQCFRFLKLLLQQNRKAIQKQNLQNLLRLEKPAIIHLQWVSNLPIFEEVINNKKHIVILSQRGFHINVRPFVNQQNKAYLQQWLPKLNGFHSVCNAIAETGNAIWTDDAKVNKTIYSGINLNRYPFNENYQKPTEALQLLSVGRNHWIKGYKYALLSCKLLKDRQIPFQYTMLGVEANEELLYLRKELNLEKQVHFVARVPKEQVITYMQQSHLLLLPSLKEGIANVVIEAMALGLPVISTLCGGIEELIEDEITGWLTNTADPEAMTRAILNFLDKQQNVIEQVRIKARKKIEEQHTEAKMIAGMEAFYQQLHERN